MLSLLSTYCMVGLIAVLVSAPWLIDYSQLVLRVRRGCPEAVHELAAEFIAHPARVAVLHLLLVAFAWHLEVVVRVVHALGMAG